MRVTAIPCLSDNYAYLVVCEQTMQAAVIDPSESAPVIAAAEGAGVSVRAIWNTHHHYDHTGGNNDLCQKWPGLTVVGHVSDDGRIPGQTSFVNDGDTIEIGEVSATIIFNPGHTTGAISFYLENPGIVFTGDTLFAAGCGRIFEGTPEQMHESLSRLAALPAQTSVYCGHEYTANNLRFAAAVEPQSDAIEARAQRVAATRALGEPTMGFSIAEERETNPFLRTDTPAVIAAARAKAGKAISTPAEMFASLRRWKDKF